MPAAESTYRSFEQKLKEAPQGFINEQLARQRAFHFRYRALEHLDKQLLDFEGHFSKNQGKLAWAPDRSSAKEEIEKITGGARLWTHRHHLLEEVYSGSQPNKTQFFDSDNLSESRQKASVEDAALLYPEFYVSENGALVFSQTDPFIGHLLSTCSKLVLLIGIEQVATNLMETETLLSLLKRYRNAATESGSYHVTFGPAKNRESQFSSQEVHVILLDNGRTNLLQEIPQRQALYCIHCGACAEVSNVKSQERPSIIKAIKAPFIEQTPESWEASFLYPLSRRANQSCPVNIDLKQLMLTNRKLAIGQKVFGRSDNLAWSAWKKAMLSRKWLNQGSSMKQFTLKSFYKKQWGESRSFPKVADKSFNQWWVETRGKDGLD